MKKGKRFLLGLAFCVLISGCAGGRFTVNRVDPGKDNSNNDVGFRYYMPKPYLLVADRVETDANGNKKVIREAKIVYLPDVSEKYSINTEGGTGSFDGGFKLEEGWRLSGVNEKYDTKTAETITALATLLKEAKPGIRTTEKARPPTVETVEFELYEIDLQARKLHKIELHVEESKKPSPKASSPEEPSKLPPGN